MKRHPTTALIPFSIGFLIITFASLQASAQVSGPLVRHETHRAAGSIEIDVDMVLVNVGVTDSQGHVIANLKRKDFRLYEDNAEQEILSFSREDVPASIGLLFDTSVSMFDKMDWARKAVDTFLAKSNPDDEFFLINFDNRPELDSPFTPDIALLQERTAALKPRGRTSLLDAIYAGVQMMKQARHDRHILLVISDGGDNHSRHHLAEIRNLLRESDSQLYALGIFDANDMKRTEEERNGPALLTELGEMTGGRLYQAATLSDLVDLSGKIGMELRSQYILGFKPVVHDGSWHHLKVALTAPSNIPLAARARSGYFSPRD
jgi:Ca-activated chloride channel family protein